MAEEFFRSITRAAAADTVSHRSS